MLKLFNYGIRGVSLQLFTSLLSSRTPSTCTVAERDGVRCNFYSRRAGVCRGVPQGSALRPSLFI